MDSILYNDICVRFLRVPFVVLVFIAFVFVSGAWGACHTETRTCYLNVYTKQCGNTATQASLCTMNGYFGYCNKDPSNGGAMMQACFDYEGIMESYSIVTCGSDGKSLRLNVRLCNNQCDLDSIACVSSGNPDASWNSANCTCDTLLPPDTTYKCVNGVLPSGTYGERPVAKIYRCIITGSSSDVCVPTSTLNGTCQDWGFCPENERDCDIDKDSTGKFPCTRSGGGTTSSGRCYYQCPDGSSLSCRPTATEYVAGAIWVGTCPERPPESCLPPSPLSSSSVFDSLLSSSSEVFDTIPPDTIDPGVYIDYTAILNAIRDTLHWANKQREILEDWDVDFMRPVKGSIENIESYSLNSWLKEDEINNNLTGLQERGFNLAADVKSDIDSSRLLLDEIKQFLKNDSLKTYSTDTTYNPLLRDIAGKLDSTGSVDSTYDLLKPFFKDTGQYKSPITRFLESFSSNFERSNEDIDFCNSYYACLSGGGRMDCVNRFPGASGRCINGGSPLDGVINIEMGILETIWDAIFGSDSTPIPRDDDSDSVDVLSPEFSSASAELQRANASLGAFNLGITLDSVRAMLERAQHMNKDTTKIQPDSLWLDSSEARRYVEHILLPSGTGTECFICHADLGTFGGLTDTTLKIHIDFADFGGYNWCEIIRAVVRIATLVVCISLTLGSWAAAFGYNPKNDA